MKKTKRILMLFLFALLVTFSFNLSKVNAKLVSYGEGDYCFNFDIDPMGFPMAGVTINEHPWDDEDDYVFYNDVVAYEIKILAGKNGNEFPEISTPGGFDAYGHIESIKNPADKQEVIGDEYLFTINIDENTPISSTCYGLGLSIHGGPEPGSNVPATTAHGNVTINITGSDIEYHYVEEKPDEPDAVRFKFAINSDHIEEDGVPFTFGNTTFKDGIMPPNATGVSTTNPIEYNYNYNGSGTVDFFFMGATNIEYSKIEINGVNYANRSPHTKDEIYEHHIGRALQFWITDIPYNENGYNVVVEGSKISTEKLVGSFGWSYKKDTEQNYDPNEDSLFTHGRLEFVQVKYTDLDNVSYVFDNVADYNNARFHNTGEIYQWVDGNKNYDDLRDAWGEALVPYGAELTIRVVPDPGYQLVGITNSSTGFTATGEVGVYKILFNSENMGSGADNFHLGAKFEAIDNEVKNYSEKVSSGTLTTNQTTENGTLMLEVNNVENITNEQIAAFEDKASEEDYTISDYLDLSLYNSIYQGGKKNSNNQYASWDTPVEATENTTVTLELTDDMSGKEIAVVHERHDGNDVAYDLIETTYDEQNNTITFETPSFSNFAIATKNTNQGGQPPETVRVSFETNGGSPLDDIIIDKGQSISRPQDPDRDGWTLVDWYEEPTFEHTYNFGSPVESNITIYALWEEANNDVKYTVEDENHNTISFTEEEGHTFHFFMTDYLTFTEEELQQNNIPLDLYHEVLENITNATKKHGKLISVYEILVLDENDHEIETATGGFKIKIKLTEEMEKYNTFKLFYVKNDFSLESPITLKLVVEGNDKYLVGTLKHLSTYALTGSTTSSSTTSNPNTGDNIIVWVCMLLISLIAIIYTSVSFKKQFSK